MVRRKQYACPLHRTRNVLVLASMFVGVMGIALVPVRVGQSFVHVTVLRRPLFGMHLSVMQSVVLIVVAMRQPSMDLHVFVFLSCQSPCFISHQREHCDEGPLRKLAE